MVRQNSQRNKVTLRQRHITQEIFIHAYFPLNRHMSQHMPPTIQYRRLKRKRHTDILTAHNHLPLNCIYYTERNYINKIMLHLAKKFNWNLAIRYFSIYSLFLCTVNVRKYYWYCYYFLPFCVYEKMLIIRLLLIGQLLTGWTLIFFSIICLNEPKIRLDGTTH